MARLAELLVRMDLDSAKFRAEITKANLSLRNIAEGAAAAAKGLFALESIKVGAELAREFGEFVAKSAEAAEQIGRLAEAAGTAPGEFAKLAYAANVSDVSTEKLGGSLAKLSKSLASASGGTGPAAAAFAALGFSTEDVQRMLEGPLDGAFLAVAERMSGFEDGAAKAAATQAIFGKGAAELIPFLNRGAEGIKELEDRGVALGVVLREETIEGADRFMEALKSLQGGATVFGATIAAELAPNLEAFVATLATGTGELSASEVVAKAVADTIKELVGFVLWAEVSFEKLGKRLAGFAAINATFWSTLWKEGGPAAWKAANAVNEEVLKDLQATEARYQAQVAALAGKGLPKPEKKEEKTPRKKLDLAKLGDDVEKEAARIDKRLADLASNYSEKIASLRAGGVEWAGEIAKINSGDIGRDIDKRFGAGTPAAEAAREKLRALVLEAANLKTQLERNRDAAKAFDDLASKVTDAELAAEKFGNTERAAVEWNLAHGDLARTFATAAAGASIEELERLEGLRERLLAAADKKDAAKKREDDLRAFLDLVNEGQGVFEQTRTPVEKYNAEIARLSYLLDRGVISQDTFNRAVREAATSAGIWNLSTFADQAGLAFGDVFANSLATGFQDGIGGMLAAWGAALQRMLADALAADLMGALGLGKGGKGIVDTVGGWIGNVFGGGSSGGDALPPEGWLAEGGPALFGRSYIVGEKGPELFSPNVSGAIIPADQVAASARAAGPGTMRVVLEDKALHRTMREWLEGQLANVAAAR